MLHSKITEAEVYTKFQDGRGRHVRISSACYKMGSCHLILTKIGTQTKKNMLSSKVKKAEGYGKRGAKIKCRKPCGFKRQRCVRTKL
jgi:hypothetical protein